MKLRKTKIIAPLGHFKVPLQGKLQKTYDKPPISSIVGILQNLFGENINDFILGFTFEYKNISKEFNKIYKEVDGRKNKYTAGRRFTGDNFITEHLVDTELIIYTDIDKKIILDETLVMGKANYLATLVSDEEVNLINQKAQGFNQWTDMSIEGGMPVRINTLTKFNSDKCAYDYETELVKNNKEFEYDKFYDEEEEQNIFLWNWKDGEINAVR
ncbi:CRISPR-associated protein Cas5 [uncultured Clostridium sp.]|jgi:CRISPR-associated protein Cas5t|uniref:CRISPR-associated protein Cas5 n=1 Tax=uncultured Clostridium sp. TaxID=59620 RepID=UPI00260C78CC|nr:CRISPR-associated protein Cas5 [uncultured Clostridium sp.]